MVTTKKPVGKVTTARAVVYTPSSDSSGAKEISDDTSSNDVNANVPAIVDIDARGDLVLRIEHETKSAKAVYSFRVNSSALQADSIYFQRLLQPGRFGEGGSIKRKHEQIRERYASTAEAPSAELPVVDIADVGRISVVRALDALLADFLHILHGSDIQPVPPVANLANLAIVADRFDALAIVKIYVQRRKTIRTLDGKTTPKIEASLTEEKVRQRLLVGLMLDYPPWIERYSLRMIMKGWVGREEDVTSATWWDLPYRVEEELAYRRDCVLDTIQSVQAHFLAIYSARDKQHCRMGYDNSPQCDSFQLGEMIRFFSRIGTVSLRGTILDVSELTTPYAGDIAALLEDLRRVPEYQIDKHHSHCGIRNRMMPILALVEDCLQHVGICPVCWEENRLQYSWIEAKRSLVWKRQDFRLRAQGHGNRHEGIRDMFTATERDWD